MLYPKIIMLSLIILNEYLIRRYISILYSIFISLPPVFVDLNLMRKYTNQKYSKLQNNTLSYKVNHESEFILCSIYFLFFSVTSSASTSISLKISFIGTNGS